MSLASPLPFPRVLLRKHGTDRGDFLGSGQPEASSLWVREVFRSGQLRFLAGSAWLRVPPKSSSGSQSQKWLVVSLSPTPWVTMVVPFNGARLVQPT